MRKRKERPDGQPSLLVPISKLVLIYLLIPCVVDAKSKGLREERKKEKMLLLLLLRTRERVPRDVDDSPYRSMLARRVLDGHFHRPPRAGPFKAGLVDGQKNLWIGSFFSFFSFLLFKKYIDIELYIYDFLKMSRVPQEEEEDSGRA